MDKKKIAIWWLHQNEQKHITLESFSGISMPSYLNEQFQSLWARNGRGRLWVDQQFGEVSVEDASFNTPLGQYLSECGGIVIYKEHIPLLGMLPGTITDLQLRRVG